MVMIAYKPNPRSTDIESISSRDLSLENVIQDNPTATSVIVRGAIIFFGLLITFTFGCIIRRYLQTRKLNNSRRYAESSITTLSPRALRYNMLRSTTPSDGDVPTVQETWQKRVLIDTELPRGQYSAVGTADRSDRDDTESEHVIELVPEDVLITQEAEFIGNSLLKDQPTDTPPLRSTSRGSARSGYQATSPSNTNHFSFGSTIQGCDQSRYTAATSLPSYRVRSQSPPAYSDLSRSHSRRTRSDASMGTYTPASATRSRYAISIDFREFLAHNPEALEFTQMGDKLASDVRAGGV